MLNIIDFRRQKSSGEFFSDANLIKKFCVSENFYLFLNKLDTARNLCRNGVC